MQWVKILADCYFKPQTNGSLNKYADLPNKSHSIRIC
jgi:hypothetical protein